jgi:hypothetical protein
LLSNLAALHPARILKFTDVFPDIPHEKNRSIFHEERRRSGLSEGDRETEPTFGLVPELSVPIETESNFLIVDNHFLQRAHDFLRFLKGKGHWTLVGPGGMANRAGF